MDLGSVLGLVAVVLSVLNTALLFVLILKSSAASNEASQGAIREEARVSREEAAQAARQLRAEVASRLETVSSALTSALGELGTVPASQLQVVVTQLREFSNANVSQSEALRGTVEAQLRTIQESNERRLEQMQQTVDEKLQGTLDRRLCASRHRTYETSTLIRRTPRTSALCSCPLRAYMQR